MQTAAIVLKVLLGVVFLRAGGQKLAGAKDVKEMFKHLEYPSWFTYVAGVVEVIGVLGMLVGTFSPTWAVLAGLLLAAQMIGAIVSHARVRDSVGKMAPASAILVLAAVVIVLEYPILGL